MGGCTAHRCEYYLIRTRAHNEEDVPLWHDFKLNRELGTSTAESNGRAGRDYEYGVPAMADPAKLLLACGVCGNAEHEN